MRKRSTLGLHSKASLLSSAGNCTVNLKYCDYWHNLLFIPSVDLICFYVGGHYLLLYHFTGFNKIIHVWIFIKMYLYLLVYFIILSVNLKLIHLSDPLPSVFISPFIIILILEMGAWLEGCFKKQSRSNLSACLLTS